MSYVGKSVAIPLGNRGLLTDLPSSNIPADALIEANNVAFEYGSIRKDSGSTKFNSTALDGGAGIVAIYDWHPDSANQRLIALTDTGKLYRDTGDGTFGAGTPIATDFGLPNNSVFFVEAGQEDTPTDLKKLFIYSRTRELGYLDGDATTLTAVTPAADWGSGNHPIGGFVFRNRHIAFGNANYPHTLYISASDNHVDFSTPATLNVFPGEFDGIVRVFVFKTYAIIFKSPAGVYLLQDNASSTPGNWSITRLDNSFGLANPNAIVQVGNDLLAANTTGSITSLTTAQTENDLEIGDILHNAQIENYIRQKFEKSGVSNTNAMYYQEKRKVYFTLRALSTLEQNRMLVIDMNQPQGPRYSIDTRNPANCIALRRDSDNVFRPIAGSADGFVYLMDDESVQSVDGNAYAGEFWTPAIDFSDLEPSLAYKNKLFDFLGVTLRGRDNTSIFVDVYLDGLFSQTLTIPQVTGVVLGEFLLGDDSLSELRIRTERKRLRGAAKRIQFRVYTTAVDFFQVENITVDFRLGNEGQERE